jgi:hypothetical protein
VLSTTTTVCRTNKKQQQSPERPPLSKQTCPIRLPTFAKKLKPAGKIPIAFDYEVFVAQKIVEAQFLSSMVFDPDVIDVHFQRRINALLSELLSELSELLSV